MGDFKKLLTLLLIILISSLPVQAATTEEINAYADAVQDFINKKCNGCKHIIIIGDDYVVPSYRTTAIMEEESLDFNGLLQSKTTTQTFCSDNYLSQYNYNLDFSHLDEVFSRGEGFEGKKTTIIIPEQSSEELLYDDLADILSIRFNADVTILTSDKVSCNDFDLFNSFNARSLILIGNHKTNSAFNCYPHFNLDTVQDSLIIDRSVWDGDESAILIGSDAGVQALITIIEERTWTELKSSELYVISNVVNGVSYTLLIGGLVSAGGATAASGGALAFLLLYADTASDSLEILNDCAIIKDSSMCKISTASIIVPGLSAKYGKAGYKIFKNTVGDLVSTNMFKKYGTELFSFLGKLYVKDSSEVTKFSTNYKKVNEYLGKEADEVLSKAAKTMDDEYHIAKGAGVLEKEGKTLIDFEKTLSDEHKLKILKSIGKYTPEFFDSKHWKQFNQLDKRLYRVDPKPPEVIKSSSGWIRSGSDDYQGYVKELKHGRFIATSRTPEGAFHGAKSSGNVIEGGSTWVYIIDPRSRNYVDALETIDNPGSGLLTEREITAIDKIDSDDIIGWAVWKEGDELPVDIITNSDYKGGMDLRDIDLYTDK